MPVIRGVDAVLLRVPGLDVGLTFYRDGLGHDLIWRTETMAGLRIGDSGTELVLTLDGGPETDLLVDSVDPAVRAFLQQGGSLIAAPRDIPVGRVAVVADPFGNALVLVDLSHGRYEVDAEARFTGVRAREPR